jgi:SH3 domain
MGFAIRWVLQNRLDLHQEDDLPPSLPFKNDFEFDKKRTSSIGNIPPPVSTSQPILKVIAAYDSRMVDELSVRPGERIQMMESYDDGWAYGMKIGGGEMGSFPLVTTVLETEVE